MNSAISLRRGGQPKDRPPNGLRYRRLSRWAPSAKQRLALSANRRIHICGSGVTSQWREPESQYSFIAYHSHHHIPSNKIDRFYLTEYCLKIVFKSRFLIIFSKNLDTVLDRIYRF